MQANDVSDPATCNLVSLVGLLGTFRKVLLLNIKDVGIIRATDCSVLGEAAGSAGVELNPGDIFVVTAGNRGENKVRDGIVVVVRVLMVDVLDQLGNLIVGRDKSHASTAGLSLNLAELQVGAVEPTLLHLDLGNELLGEQLLRETGGALLVPHGEYTERDASGGSPLRRFTGLPLVREDVLRDVGWTKLDGAVRNNILAGRVSGVVGHISLGGVLAIATLVE